ncbi:RING finger protein narya-like isoform X2 [Drosophila tropicalis]|uniref:RING finger protein narya-like isoform X2 n=1 Tax=Drosophila tropicalis TaxID=46794 RepID=UPI0035AB8B71
MFRVHCNKCGQLKASEPNRSFYITRCQHIACSVCLAAQKALCPICQRSFQGTEINANLPSPVASYFQDPQHLLDLWKRISKFQHEQVASDNLHFWHRQQKAKDVKRDLEGLTKLSVTLSNKNEREKQKINKIRDYISHYERALESDRDISDEHMRSLMNTSLDSNVLECDGEPKN